MNHDLARLVPAEDPVGVALDRPDKVPVGVSPQGAKVPGERGCRRSGNPNEHSLDAVVEGVLFVFQADDDLPLVGKLQGCHIHSGEEKNQGGKRQLRGEESYMRWEL